MGAWLLENLILVVTQWWLFYQLLGYIKFRGHVRGNLRPLELFGGSLRLLEVLLLLRSLAEVYKMSFFPHYKELCVDQRVQEERVLFIVIHLDCINIKSLIPVGAVLVSLRFGNALVVIGRILVVFKVLNQVPLLWDLDSKSTSWKCINVSSLVKHLLRSFF